MLGPEAVVGAATLIVVIGYVVTKRIDPFSWLSDADPYPEHDPDTVVELPTCPGCGHEKAADADYCTLCRIEIEAENWEEL